MEVYNYNYKITFYTSILKYHYLTGGTNQMVEFQSNLLSLGLKGTRDDHYLVTLNVHILQLSKFNNNGIQ